MATEIFTNDASTTVSTGGTTAPAGGTVQTWTVASSTGFPAASSAAGTQFHVADTALPNEVILVTNVSGTTWTVTRGAEGSTPVAHTAGFTIQQVVTAGWLNSALVGVSPSGDTSGVQDTKNIMNAINSLTGGGTVFLGPGNFYVAYVSGWSNSVPLYTGVTGAAIVLPAQTTSGGTGAGPVNLQGSGQATVLNAVGAAVTGIYCHRVAKFGTFPTFFAGQIYPGSYVRDMVIDGIGATGASVGLDIGDGVGYDVREVTIRNFSGTGAIGLNLISRVTSFYTEESNFGPMYLINNTKLVIMDGANSAASHDYSTFEFHFALAAGQDGLVLQNGANPGGSRIYIQGNVQTSSTALTSAIIRLTGASSINYGHIEMRIETDQALGNAPASIVFDTSACQIYKCTGYLNPSGAGNPSLAGGEFTFNGPIVDSVLSQVWPSTSFPGLGTAWQNLGPNALVCVSGGTITGISINGVATNLTTGAFFVPAGGNITVNGSVAPTHFNVVPASWPQN